MVIWLLGLSGAGKTTLGNKLNDYMKNKNLQSYIIDGDIVRSLFDNDLGYEEKDRIENIKRIIFGAYILEENGVIPIVCNISPFKNLRDLAREKFADYKEIYLKRDLKDIMNKDEVYSQKNVIGVDMRFDKPNNSFLTLDTSKLSVEECFEILIKKLEI